MLFPEKTLFNSGQFYLANIFQSATSIASIDLYLKKKKFFIRLSCQIIGLVESRYSTGYLKFVKYTGQYNIKDCTVESITCSICFFLDDQIGRAHCAVARIVRLLELIGMAL